MKRAVIVLNGNKPTKKLINSTINKPDIIICADGGAGHVVSAGLIPHVIIGDQDSIHPTLKDSLSQNPIEWITYPKEKDETDSELALHYAIAKGYKEILILGMMGSRLDHVLSNIFFLTQIPSSVSTTIIDETQKIYIVSKNITLLGNRGEYVSLIPLKNDVTGITLKGFKYPLSKETLFFGKTRGISNQLLGKTADISITSGVLLVIHSQSTDL